MMRNVLKEALAFLEKYDLDQTSTVKRISQWFKWKCRGYLFVYNEADIRCRVENVHRVVDVFQLAVATGAIVLSSSG